MTIKAKYQLHPVPSLNGNPLTEAIQIHTDGADVRSHLMQMPDIGQDIWRLPSVYQGVELRKLDRLHVPVPYLSALYNKFASLILDSYSKYNPLTAEVNRLQMQAAIAAGNNKYLQGNLATRTTAPSVLVSGVSGTGKTTTIRRVLSAIPQVISHESYNGNAFKQDQLVWLSFDLPATASIKGLALNFFEAVDVALGTDYYNEWKDKSHRTIERHLGQIQVITLTHYLGLVHIDELQFMLEYRKSKGAPSFITIEALFNKLGIPIVLSCTSTGRNSLLIDKNSADFTTTRRLLSDREFKFSIYRLKDSFFNEMFEALFSPLLSTDGKVPGNDFKINFHFYTCGLPAVMTRLAYLHHETIAQLRANNPENERRYQTNDVSRLGQVFKNQFGLISKALDNLRAGNTDAFEQEVLKSESGKGCFTNKEIGEAVEMKRKKTANTMVIDNADAPGVPTIISDIDKDAMNEFINGDTNG